MPRPIALTGTPGTGKSEVARRLSRGWHVVEVGDLAQRFGAAQGSGRRRSVDLPKLIRGLERTPPDDLDLVVGHLAHFLPVRGAIVLRCHPLQLERRLRRARRGTARERRQNFVVESTDGVLVEALARKVPVWEVDTTARRVAEVTRAVDRRLRRRGPSQFGRVDWLADPRVTEHLLDEGP
jgi:adenylate kinase